MEPKAIKEELPDSKDSPGQTPPPADLRRSKGIKSPGSPEDGISNTTTPPCLSHVTSTLHTTPPPSGAASLLSPNTSNTGSSSPPAAAPRPTLGKLKRFLSTLVQFGVEISHDLGDRVRGLVLSMVNGNITIEEFHTSLQEATNFPLRPFVLPFLKTHLPLLQREISFQARLAKQTTSQYLRHHEQLVLDPSFSPSEPSEIFSSEQPTENGKRKHSESIYENGITSNSKEDQTGSSEPPHKRERLQTQTHPMPLLFNPLPFPSAQLPASHMFGSHAYTSGFNTSLLGSSFHLLQGVASAPPHLLGGASDYTSHTDSSAPRNKDLPLGSNSGDEEWKNINTMLNCILSMVEKTKRALSILQTRDRGVTAGESDMKRAANEIIRITEDRIAEIKRRAEEAVNEVKRQAMVELERIMVKSGKSKEELEEVVAQETSQQNLCWNCGRKAQETCSGCNTARYCGSYCQHRDWENHHQVCCAMDKRHITLGSTSRHVSDDRRHLFEDRRTVLDERRSFQDELQTSRRHSSDENRQEGKEVKRSKASQEDKDRCEVEKRTEATDRTEARERTEGRGDATVTRSRLLPNISNQILNLDNIRRMKNHVLVGDNENAGLTNPLRSSRTLNSSRSTTPVPATSSITDK